jgi:hypothetical protein
VDVPHGTIYGVRSMRKIWLIAATLAYVLHASPAKSQALVDVSCAPPGSTQPVSCRTPGLGNAGYPPGATPVASSGTGSAAAATATLPGVNGKVTYLCGFYIGATATAAAAGNATVTGVSGGTLNFEQGTGASPAVSFTSPNFGNFCVPASGQNVALVLTTANPGAGGVISASAWGFQF